MITLLLYLLVCLQDVREDDYIVVVSTCLFGRTSERMTTLLLYLLVCLAGRHRG